MTQEKSPEDEAFDAITQSQQMKEAGDRAAKVVKDFMSSLNETMMEAEMNALAFGTGIIKLAHQDGGLQISSVHPKDIFFSEEEAKAAKKEEEPDDLTVAYMCGRSDARNAVLEEVAKEFDKMKVFGTTAESFATFVRGMKR